jgi:hypothetical protein
LREELYKKEQFINSLQDNLATNDEIKNEMIKHMTGMNRIARPEGKQEFHSIPQTGGIQNRIRRAEMADRKEATPLVLQRQKEYNERLDSLLGNEKPETEIVEEPTDALG